MQQRAGPVSVNGNFDCRLFVFCFATCNDGGRRDADVVMVGTSVALI